MSVEKNQIIVAELLKQFRDANDDFMSVLKDHSDKVYNDVINFNEIGIDPDVLINNTTYPIATNGRTDNTLPVSLFKLETENTIITDDELQALPYDKKSSVLLSHKYSLKKETVKLGLHSLSPTVDTFNTPVIETSGAIVGGRRRLMFDDLVTFKNRCDKLEIPNKNRNLVLCSDHVSDLILIDNTFRDRFANTPNGRVINNIVGFNIYENNFTPTYDGITLNKKVYGSSFLSTDRSASVFFSQVNAIKAIGSLQMHLNVAAEDPENRQTIIGFKMYFITSPVSLKGQGAIISGV